MQKSNFERGSIKAQSDAGKLSDIETEQRNKAYHRRQVTIKEWVVLNTKFMQSGHRVWIAKFLSPPGWYQKSVMVLITGAIRQLLMHLFDATKGFVTHLFAVVKGIIDGIRIVTLFAYATITFPFDGFWRWAPEWISSIGLSLHHKELGPKSSPSDIIEVTIKLWGKEIGKRKFSA